MPDYDDALVEAVMDALMAEIKPQPDLVCFHDAARAAIAAVLEWQGKQEPTEAMIDAAMGPWANLYPGFEGEKPHPKAGEVATTIYRAMVAAR